jgi:hypothetical protein
MPTLHEWQTAMRRSLVDNDQASAAAMLAARIPPERLDIYRNTFVMTVTKALHLCYPAIEKLVGEAFFEGAAQLFMIEHPPRVAWLDQYGEGFPGFLRTFGPAASVCYLHDVARLEWAVHCSLHAQEAEPLDPATLATVAPELQGRIRLIAAPSLALLRLSYPADTIWRAVLLGDDEALARIAFDCGLVHLLIERRASGVEVTRLDRRSWQFLARLSAGDPLELVLANVQGDSAFDSASAVAEHLAAGRFSGFELGPHSTTDDPVNAGAIV